MNTMQYGTDGFEFRRQALLKSRQCLDFTQETSVPQLIIAGTQPDGTSRRVIFEIDGRLYRFVNGALDIYDDRGELDDILADGNTVDELMALENIAGFVGKKVFPVIALDAPADAPVLPRIKISAKVNSYNDIYSKTETSPIYELAPNGRIVRVSTAISTNGFGTVTVKCRLKNPVTGWGDWLATADASGKLASAIQFQANYVLTTLDGSDSAKVDNVQTDYTTDAFTSAADFFELVTTPQEFSANLGTCYALVKHDALLDCGVSAFVKFAPPVQHREVSLGNATGREQTFNLPDRFLIASSLHLEIGGRTIQNFYYDTQNSGISFTGEAGAAIFVSYDFGAEEIWREMAVSESAAEATKFVYRLSESINSKVSAVKIRFTKKAGHVEEALGVGTGREQIFATEHRATSLTCTAPFKYDEQTHILRTLAPIDESITAAYNWKGAFPNVREIICGWQARY